MTAENASIKAQLHAAIDEMPDDVDYADALYTLYVRASIAIGEAEIARGEGIPHEQVVADLKKWLEYSERRRSQT